MCLNELTGGEKITKLEASYLLSVKWHSSFLETVSHYVALADLEFTEIHLLSLIFLELNVCITTPGNIIIFCEEVCISSEIFMQLVKYF